MEHISCSPPSDYAHRYVESMKDAFEVLKFVPAVCLRRYDGRRILLLRSMFRVPTILYPEMRSNSIGCIWVLGHII